MTHLKLRLSLIAAPLLAVGALALGTSHAAGPKNGLVAHYCFNSTLIDDCSGRGNPGTASGSVTPVPGILGKAAKFGGYGNTGSIMVPNSPTLSLGNNFTISYWVRVDDPAGENAFGSASPFATQIAVAKSHDARGWFSYIAPAPAASDGFAGFIDYGAGALSGSPTTVEIGKWKHVAVTYRANPGRLRIYVDGALARVMEPANFDFAVANGQPLYLGAAAPLFGSFYRYPLNGALDEVRIYNRELAAVEVALTVRSDRYGVRD